MTTGAFPLNRNNALGAPEAAPTGEASEDQQGVQALERLLLNRLDDEKAQDIVFIDLKDKSSVADGMIVASGRSHRHVGAMADHLLRALKDAGHGKARVEGLPHCDWVLIDAGDVIVHLFRPEVRAFYNIEKIWSVEPPHRAVNQTLRISLICVGRLGRSPEAAVARDYAERASAAGRSLGLAPVEIVEVESRKPGKAPEAEAILASVGEARLIACDERGKAMGSRDFATRIGRLRDDGVRHLAFAIGGADGLDAAVTEAASELLAFGPQTWPHALARTMLAEQVYRAVTILAGSPYHRD